MNHEWLVSGATRERDRDRETEWVSESVSVRERERERERERVCVCVCVETSWPLPTHARVNFINLSDRMLIGRGDLKRTVSCATWWAGIHISSVFILEVIVPTHSLVWMGIKFKTQSLVFYSTINGLPDFLHVLFLSCNSTFATKQQLLPSTWVYCRNSRQDSQYRNSDIIIFYFLYQFIIIIIIIIRHTLTLIVLQFVTNGCEMGELQSCKWQRV